jgi:uncharacterized protein YjbI with pentapeptide repeats
LEILLNQNFRLGANRVLDRVSLSAAGGEFIALLGASGCGEAIHVLRLSRTEAPFLPREFALMANVTLRGACLREADMSGAQLDAAVLIGADLRKVNVRGAGFRDARLDRADLRDARLGGAFLVGTLLRGADLRGAYLRLARLDDADLSDANLDGGRRLDAGSAQSGASQQRDEAPRRLDRGGRWQTMSMSRCSPMALQCGMSGGPNPTRHQPCLGPVCEAST